MVIFKTVVGNTHPEWQFPLARGDADTPISLEGGATVRLVIKDNGGNVMNTGHQACTVTDAAGGIVTYTPQATDLPRAGRYTGDVVIDFGSSDETLHELLVIAVRD